jgi:uncharacterized protein
MAHITTTDALRARIEPANPMTKLKVLDHLDSQAREFVARSPFLLLSTQNPDGSLEVSPKGDVPGFVHVEDPRTLLVPDRAGNGLAFGLTNLLANPELGLIFLLPATGDTLRVSGRASLHDDEDLCARLAARGKPAKLAIRVAVTRAYFHCARSLMRAKLWQPESWGPRYKVSMGRVFQEQQQADETLAARIDRYVERSSGEENL